MYKRQDHRERTIGELLRIHDTHQGRGRRTARGALPGALALPMRVWMVSAVSEYRVAAWRIRQLDTLARRVLSALAAAAQAEDRLSAVRDARRPAVFDHSYYEQEVENATLALRDGARRLAMWSMLGAAAAKPGSERTSRGPAAEGAAGGAWRRGDESTL